MESNRNRQPVGDWFNPPPIPLGSWLLLSDSCSLALAVFNEQDRAQFSHCSIKAYLILCKTGCG